MSEVKNFNDLIKAGQTRDEFITQYKTLAKEDAGKDKSIFSQQMDDAAISRLFDSITGVAADDGDGTDNAKISETDVKKLAEYDGDASSITEEDMVKYYEEKISKSTITEEPVAGTESMTAAEAIDLMSDLQQLRISTDEKKLNILQSQINNLIQNDSKLSDRIKKEAKEAYEELTKLQRQLVSKRHESEELARKINITQAEITKKQAQYEGIQSSEKKESLQKDIDALTKELQGYQNQQTKLTTEMTTLAKHAGKQQKVMDGIYEKVENKDANLKTNIQDARKSAADFSNSVLNIDNTYCDTAKFNEIMAQCAAAAKSAGASSAYYANGGDGTIGQTAAQALANATGEIGVKELTGHNDGPAINKYRNGAANGAAWCASFVSWCYKGNGVFGYQASVSGIMAAAQQKGKYAAIGSYKPIAGDVMIQKSNGASHTGIVEKVDPDGTIHTIEGNASNSVKRCVYKPGLNGYSKISGWVKMSA